MLSVAVITALGIGAVVAWAGWAVPRMLAEAGARRVRGADLAGEVGARVRFRHPTDRTRMVEGRVLAVRESALCLAWVRVTIEAADGSRTDYEITGRTWATVAR